MNDDNALWRHLIRANPAVADLREVTRRARGRLLRGANIIPLETWFQVIEPMIVAAARGTGIAGADRILRELVKRTVTQPKRTRREWK